jgi:hypothetical protein
MDQDNTKPSPGGTRGSWRDRLGINKELPKISEEFKQAPQKPAPSDRQETVIGKAGVTPRPGTPIAKPAPMAPRANAAELGERLRKQREAAERMAEQRVAEAKERAIQISQVPQTPQSQRPAPPAANASIAPGNARPRFTFADEELRQTNQQPAGARDQAPRQSGSGQVPATNTTRPVFTADRQGQTDPRIRNTAPPARQTGSAVPPSYARTQQPLPPQRVPSSHPPGYSPPGAPDRHWQPRSPRQTPPPAHEHYRRDMPAEAARQLEDPYAEEDPYRRQQRQPEPPRPRSDYRGAHSRELAYVEEEPDDLFEDDQNYSAQPRRRATSQEYAQAYREFENDYEQPEPRRRTGPLLLIGALIAVGAIAGGLIYFYQKSTMSAQTSGDPAGEANVPVVAEPAEPVKTEPEPTATAEETVPATQQQSMAPSTEAQVPSQTKQIYDRILGETTLEEQEQIAPSEEQPVAPEGPSQGLDSDPLPLPLPPPPGGDDQSGALETPAPQATAANTKSAAENISQQASPASASVENEPAVAAVAPEASTVQPAEPSAEPAIPKPELKTATAEQKIQSEFAFAEQPVAPAPVSDDSGPVQIAQLPESGTASAATAFNAFPQSLPDPTESSSAGVKRPTMLGRASDRVFVKANKNFNRSKSVEIAQLEPAPLITQSIAQPRTQSAATAPQPAEQQQAALPTPPPGTEISKGALSGFIIQLASYKTEADALAEYERLHQLHESIISGLTPSVQKADLGTNGTFYRLHLGSFPSKQAAKSACTSLLAAGERDCLVKTR